MGDLFTEDKKEARTSFVAKEKFAIQRHILENPELSAATVDTWRRRLALIDGVDPRVCAETREANIKNLFTQMGRRELCLNNKLKPRSYRSDVSFVASVLRAVLAGDEITDEQKAQLDKLSGVNHG